MLGEVLKLSDKVMFLYLWSFEGSFLTFAGIVVRCIAKSCSGLRGPERFPAMLTPQECVLSLVMLH